jgi:hypothetical protein
VEKMHRSSFVSEVSPVVAPALVALARRDRNVCSSRGLVAGGGLPLLLGLAL